MSGIDTPTGHYALLFTGRGKPAWDMALTFVNADRASRDQFQLAVDVLGRELIELTCHRDPKIHGRVEVQTVSNVLASAIAFDYARRNGLAEPGAVSGLSLGETVAAYAAGVVDFPTVLRLAHYRGVCEAEIARTLPPGGVGLLIGTTEDGAKDLCAEVSGLGHIEMVGILGPNLQLIAGMEPALSEAAWLAGEMGWRWLEQAVEGPWHLPMFQPAVDKFLAYAETQPFKDPEVTLLSGAQEAPIADASTARAVLADSITAFVDAPLTAQRLRAVVSSGMMVRVTPRGAMGRPEVLPPHTVPLNAPKDLPALLGAVGRAVQA